jgi:hypothetical protein
MRRSTLSLLAALLLLTLSSSCRTRMQGPPEDIAVFVDYDANSGKIVAVIPENAVVDFDSQSVRWYTNAAGLEIVFDNPRVPAPRCPAGTGRCDPQKFPRGIKGKHKYTAYAIDTNGRRAEKDPYVIIHY